MGVKGADQTGTVSCVVDLSGRLVKVGIDNRWWDTLGPDRVGHAVLDALRFAKYKAGMARLVLLDYGREVDQKHPDPETLFTTEPPEELPPFDDPRFEGALMREANRTLEVLEEAERFIRRRDSHERQEIYGPHRLFRVILSGLDIVDVELSDHGLHRPSGEILAEDACAALQAASPSALLVRR
jgi:hypothetical protein